VLSDLLVEPGRQAALAHVRAARVGRDREPRRDRHTELRHLGKTDSLASQQLPAALAGLVECVHEPRHGANLVIDTRMTSPQLLGLGGQPDDRMLDHALGLARGAKVLYVPTASNEDPSLTVEWYARLRGRAELTPVHFYPWPPGDLRELTLAHDVVLVPGGNTANMLAIWRVHGFERDPP